MPYIPQSDRQLYIPQIQSLVACIRGVEDDKERVDCVGAVCSALVWDCFSLAMVKHFWLDLNGKPYIDDTRRLLSKVCEKYDLRGLGVAGVFNYILSAIIWSAEVNERYNFRSRVTGRLELLFAEVLGYETEELAVAADVQVMFCGVLRDMLNERYALPFRSYEEVKKRQHGDILPLK